MINLKLSKAEKKEQEKAYSIGEESYPYGTRLSFQSQLIKKIPFLQKVKGGAIVNIQAIAKATEIRIRDKGKGDERENVEIQIQKIDIGSANEAEESFNEE